MATRLYVGPIKRNSLKLRIFVGSSGEALGVCRAVQAELEDDFEVTVWNQDVFNLSEGALESLLGALDSSDAGIFVLQGDDVTLRRGQADPSVRDNVIFELGMFVGRLGPGRTFMLTPSVNPAELPSDLHGLTTAIYDAPRFMRGERRPAVATTCTRIRDHLERSAMDLTGEPSSRKRLNRAMACLGADLESLLSVQTHDVGVAKNRSSPLRESMEMGRATVNVEVGRIEDRTSDDTRHVVALPANEYFDRECVSDLHSALGAYVSRHFDNTVHDFVEHIDSELAGLEFERVPRAERRIDNSYGIGRAIFLRDLPPPHRLILVSATTERTGIGLRSEPHFLYAAVHGVVEAMNEHRFSRLVIPIFGSGHGGIPLVVALLFNLLALRTCLVTDLGRNIREVTLVIFEGAAQDLTESGLREVMSRASAR